MGVFIDIEALFGDTPLGQSGATFPEIVRPVAFPELRA
jgi:hypothetical protein